MDILMQLSVLGEVLEDQILQHLQLVQLQILLESLLMFIFFLITQKEIQQAKYNKLTHF